MSNFIKNIVKLAKEYRASEQDYQTKQVIAARAKTVQEYQQLFEQKFKQLNYRFLNVEVINKRKYVIYECPIHGVQQIRCDLIQNAQVGCKKCQALQRRMPLQTFKQLGAKIHNNKYSYDKVKYNNLHEKVIITCPTHGDFSQRACSHIFECKGCKLCYQDTLS